MKQRKSRPTQSNNGLRRKRRARKPRWLSQLEKTKLAPKSQYHDGMKWPTALPGKVVELYPPKTGSEPSPHYHKHLEEIDETFWCETIGLPISSKAKTSTPVATRKTDTARCLNRLANPQLFPKCKGCKKYDDVPVVKKAEHRVCTKCGEAKPHPQFKGAYEIAEEFIGWCNTCVSEYVDTIKHPVDRRGAYLGPPERDNDRTFLDGGPARQGCIFCDDGFAGEICQSCISELDRYKPMAIEKLYQLFFNDDVRRELIETYSRVTDAAMARVEKEYEGFNQEYFTFTNTGRSIAYEKEKDNGKSKTVGRIHLGEQADGLVGNGQETGDLSEATQGTPICSSEQDPENVPHTFDIGVDEWQKSGRVSDG